MSQGHTFIHSVSLQHGATFLSNLTLVLSVFQKTDDDELMMMIIKIIFFTANAKRSGYIAVIPLAPITVASYL